MHRDLQTCIGSFTYMQTYVHTYIHAYKQAYPQTVSVLCLNCPLSLECAAMHRLAINLLKMTAHPPPSPLPPLSLNFSKQIKFYSLEAIHKCLTKNTILYNT